MGERTGREGMTTASMQVYEQQRSTGGTAGDAGLVLLYAPGYERLEPCYPLSSARVLVGREPPAGILVPQPAVSRRHAELRREGDGWVLRDLGARNGTLVNGAFVREHRLHHGDEIRVGDAFFKLVGHDAHGYRAYRIDGAVLAKDVPTTPSGLVGGHQLACIAAALERIARSNIAVVLLGESGTGKEVLARQVHRWSERTGAFRALNCAAIPATLLESELFGYRRGAFSGADRDHVGLVRTADRGTLFLDEVGDLPLAAQAKLLRVLQTKEVLPLGATTPEQVDIRVVCATHRDLSAMQAAGSFRGDLFARLNEYSVTLPPLRARKEDIYALILEFLRLHKRPDLVPSVPYLTGLLHYHFPYNVRELEALIKRAIALCDGSTLEAAQLSAEIHACMHDYGRRAEAGSLGGMQADAAVPTPPLLLAQARPPAPSWPPSESESQPSPLSETAMAQIPLAVRSPIPTEAELRQLLAQSGGNVAAVGRHYGKERMQVHRWMRRYRIDPDEYR